MRRLLASICLLPGLALVAGQPAMAATSSSCVKMTTNEGSIALKLYPQKAPKTVENFLEYVDAGFYNGTIFHRVIPNFMIQGGGFSKSGNRQKTRAAIANESDNGLKNHRGTIAMARTSAPNSATSQFFINLVNNNYLNYQKTGPTGNGYAVFGKVVKGMKVADKIGGSPTHVGSLGGYGAPNVPVKPVIIKQMARINCPKGS